MTCRKCQHETVKKFGYNRNKTRRYRCTTCSATFSDPAPAPVLVGHTTANEKAVQALSMMLEGMSVRAISRITGLHKNTILALMLTAAQNAQRVLETRISNIKANYVECDEVWCFVSKKAKRVRKADPAEFGDQWVFVALDAETKLIPCFEVGKRTRETTYKFLTSLQSHLSEARFQLTTDGFHFYQRGVEDVFAGQADFAQLVKLYGDYGQHDAAAKYSPGKIMEVISKIRDGQPDPEHISTSYVERSNLSLRMHLRRFTRLTNAFSKKLENLKAAVCLWFAFYNFCRVHQSLRVTPAMEAGITDHVWSLAELLSAE
ncbi:MAG TPA: IS1 family transposase [Candidatus Angelobacter sp.]|nr:IS1 family transposase [Candidatus Angelobacter sp.]